MSSWVLKHCAASQEDGGPNWNVSLGEVQTSLETNQAMPEHLQQLMDNR